VQQELEQSVTAENCGLTWAVCCSVQLQVHTRPFQFSAAHFSGCHFPLSKLPLPFFSRTLTLCCPFFTYRPIFRCRVFRLPNFPLPIFPVAVFSGAFFPLPLLFFDITFCFAPFFLPCHFSLPIFPVAQISVANFSGCRFSFALFQLLFLPMPLLRCTVG